MSHETFTLDELARHLGLDRRKIEKLVNRGRIPGRKIGGEWQFHQMDITHWLEQEMREFTERELADLEVSQQSMEVNKDIPVTSLLRRETVLVPLEAKTKRSVLESLVEVAGRTWEIWEPAAVLKAVQEREDVFPTGFENGVAIPHPRNPMADQLGRSILAFGRTHSPIPFGAPKGKLTDLFFLVLTRDSRTHLQVLARLGRMIQNADFLKALRVAHDSTAAFEAICEWDQKFSQDQPL